MKIAYRKQRRWTKKTSELLEKIVKITEEYYSKGFKLTSRQLFYQLVSKDIVQNNQNQYFRLGKILTKARMCGLVDWDAIEDRIRIPKIPTRFDGIPDLIYSALYSYRRDRWKDQENYLEVWLEKDALANILEPVTRKYDVALQVNRGYISSTAIHDAFLRLSAKTREDRRAYILYLGDHDPSGTDMVRDIDHRLTEFGCLVTINKIALTKEQIEKYNPPPNLSKKTDPRTKNYVKEHGIQSWELDALPPNILHDLVESEIGKLLDMKKFSYILEKEELEKTKIEELITNFPEI